MFQEEAYEQVHLGLPLLGLHIVLAEDVVVLELQEIKFEVLVEVFALLLQLVQQLLEGASHTAAEAEP